MAVVVSPDSAFAKELTKWDTPKRLGGYKCDGFEAFPKMLYRAFKDEGGKVRCYEINPKTGEPYPGVTLSVNSEDERIKALNQGWVDGTPKDAIDAFEKAEQAIGNAAAEAIASAKRMSATAQREMDDVQASTMAHVADITKHTKKQIKEREA